MKNLNLILRKVTSSNYLLKSSISTSTVIRNVAAAKKEQQPIAVPNFDNQAKTYPAKIQQLVDQIANLNLIEVSDLNELLRKKLNIKDVAMSFTAAGPVAAAPVAKEEEAEPEAVAPKATKSSFRLKITKFDDTKKVALIKEIKALGENMNLVQAKKFVESLPQVFKDNIGKDDAEKIKAQLEKVGATCELE